MEDLDKRVNLHFPSLAHFAYGQTYEGVAPLKDTIYTFFFSWDSTVSFLVKPSYDKSLNDFISKEIQLMKKQDSLNVRLINY